MEPVSLPPPFVDLVEGGASVLVATSDLRLRPEATRACGAKVSPDRRRVVVYLPTAVSARARQNLAEHPEIAAGISRPLDNLSIQVKGPCVEVRTGTEEDRAVVERYLAQFRETLYLIGLPRSLTARFNAWPVVAVTFEVRDVFVQTPGPGAGKRLERA